MSLIDTLKKNRAQHVDDYKETWDGYKEKSLEAITKLLAAARDAQPGDSIDTSFFLRAPENHVADYDRVIGLLEMALDTNVVLDEGDYAKYVLDDWDWKQAWVAVSSAYNEKFR